MTQTRTIKTKAGATVAAIGVAALVAACGSSGHSNHAASVSGTPASDRTLQISVVSGHDGRYLAGANDHAVYLWVADGHDKSRCTSGACAKYWPAVLTKSTASAGPGVKSSDLGTIAHKGGERQVTYDGHPLYYFAGDTARGMTKGQGSNGFGAKWWLVSPSGSAITHSASAGGSGSSPTSSTTTTTSSSSSSSGSGW
jgi:predicted lipoprotein with Yx(FWY)xxD motif